MVTVQGEDYMTFAEAKGLRSGRLFLRYGVRNAVLPQMTALALYFGQIVTGAVLVEIVFSYPGVGSLIYTAIVQGDYNLLMGTVSISIVAVATATLFVDLLYPLLDPRIRHR
jgi:peptide/nickel transport system permease protein